jgi:Xaa-Pro aminopeptidase
MIIRLAGLALVLAVNPVSAQSLGPAPDPVAALPGYGRPVDVEATRLRRQQLALHTGPGVIVIPAATSRDLEDLVLQDNDFRQDDYFFYLTGLESPNAWLVIAAGASGVEQSHLVLPRRNVRQEQWTGRKLGPGPEAAELTGVMSVLSLDALDSLMAASLSQSGGPLRTVVARQSEGSGRIRRWLDPAEELIDVRPLLDSLRTVKDDAEMVRLRRAIDITALAHRAAMQAVRPNMYEYQLEAEIEYTFRVNGADRVGFPSIVGSGPNSTTLHYDINRRRMGAGDVVVMDIGAEYGQYTADVTRTIPVNGRFTPRQRDIYSLVLGAQQAAIDAVRPGVTFEELNGIARSYVDEHSGELCGGQSCKRYSLHGISHHLGMRVHDVGDRRLPLQAGAVFTIEPGLYINDENLGIRIEDDILVTATGAEILSANAPRTVEAIEELMRGASRIP